MPLRRPRVRVIETVHPRYRWMVKATYNGKKKTAYFKDGEKKLAETKKSQMEAELFRLGGEVFTGLEDTEKRFLADAKEKLAKQGKTLRDAVDHYFGYLGKTRKLCTVGQATDKLLSMRLREGISPKYQRDLEQKLFKFCRSFRDEQIGDITTERVSDWLQTLQDGGLAPVSIHSYRRALSVLFNYCIANGYITSNPSTHAFKPKVRTTIGILTPGEMRSLLEHAHPEIVPVIAIGGFAGLRRSELERLDWKDIDFGKGLIRLDAHQTKTATCRDVRILPNLGLWLTPYMKSSGPLWPEEHERGRNLLDAAKRAIGFGSPGTETCDEKAKGIALRPWPRNALRHSFGSYHYAMFEDAAQASAQMGHSSVNTFWAHYRKKASKDDAETFWAIRPITAAAERAA